MDGPVETSDTPFGTTSVGVLHIAIAPHRQIVKGKMTREDVLKVSRLRGIGFVCSQVALMLSVIIVTSCVLYASPLNKKTLKSGDAKKATQSLWHIQEAFKNIQRKDVTWSNIQSLRRHMDDFEIITDRYFSAHNLRQKNIRPTVLALRETIREAMAGSDPIVRLFQDQLVFRPKLHLSIANHCVRLQQKQCAKAHLKAAARSGENSPELLKSIKGTLEK